MASLLTSRAQQSTIEDGTTAIDLRIIISPKSLIVLSRHYLPHSGTLLCRENHYYKYSCRLHTALITQKLSVFHRGETYKHERDERCLVS